MGIGPRVFTLPPQYHSLLCPLVTWIGASCMHTGRFLVMPTPLSQHEATPKIPFVATCGQYVILQGPFHGKTMQETSRRPMIYCMFISHCVGTVP